MPTLPRARTRLDDAAGSFGSGAQVIAVCAPVPGVLAVEAALFSSTTALIEEYPHNQGIEYSALHFDETGLPVLFCAMPIGTAGTVSHFDDDDVTGTSAITVVAGADGVIESVDGMGTVTTGGTIGADQIMFDLTLDGGFSSRSIRLGTAVSYTIPYVGLVINFGAGTLVAGDRFYFRSKAPTWDAAGATAVRLALAAKNVDVRSWIFIGDALGETEADAARAAAEAYATSNDRFVLARVQARDQLRPAAFAGLRGRTVGASLTFAEVGGTGDTITRAAGSWITDGFAVGDSIVVTGAVAGAGANNVTGVIASLTALVITLGSTDLVAEGPITSATVAAYSTLTFAEVGATGDTITRSSGSWISDGFAAGMNLDVDGSASNDFVGSPVVTVSATVLTLDTQDLVAEVISGSLVTALGEESKADWREDLEEEYEDMFGDDYRRIDIAAGYGSKLSPLSGWRFRRPAAWAASLREYKHDHHIPNWRVADGALGGWTLEDSDGDLAEHDERVDGALLPAGFTTLRTWNNEAGVFVALSQTRADPGSMLSRTHNMYVANVACSTVQRATQREIGQVLELQTGANNPNRGKATEPSLALLESRINAQLLLALRKDFGEGPRASSAIWQASRDDVLNVPGATVTGVLTLELNGTIEQIDTRVAVPVAA